MKNDTRKLSLVDMDLGLFVSYELSARLLKTKLFRVITLRTISLKQVQDFRIANEDDVPSLNRLNQFYFIRSRRGVAPIYTLKTARAKPRVFMRLDEGSHLEMQSTLGELHAC